MRFTVTRKVIAGQATILVVGIVTFAAVYTGLTQLDEALRDHAEVHEPASAATYEMEINTNGTFMAVLKYLDRPDPASRARARKDLGDYERFFAQYMSLMQDEDGRKLGASLQGYYADFKTLAGLIMERRDEQEAIFVRVALHFETIDDIIGKQLLPWLEPSDPHRTAKVEHMTSVEADVAEVGIWVANYQRTHDPRYRALIAANEAELRKTLSRLEALPLSAPEQRWIRTLTLKLNDVMRGLREIVALEDSLREDARRFVSLHQAMDDLLDEQVQMVARRQLERPILDAERATAAVLGRVRILIPVFVLTAFGVALLVIRLIRHPIRRLIHGTHLIASGDLSHRIAAGRDDEFGELGREFNRMVAELQETTVSRQLWSLTFDAIDSAIVVVDAERRVVQLNRAARELAGGSDGAVTRQILDDVGKGEPWRAAVTLARDMGQHGTAVAQHVQDEATGRSWEVAVNVFGRLDAS